MKIKLKNNFRCFSCVIMRLNVYKIHKVFCALMFAFCGKIPHKIIEPCDRIMAVHDSNWISIRIVECPVQVFGLSSSAVKSACPLSLLNSRARADDWQPMTFGRSAPLGAVQGRRGSADIPSFPLHPRGTVPATGSCRRRPRGSTEVVYDARRCRLVVTVVAVSRLLCGVL